MSFVITGDENKVVKDATSRPVTLYRASDASGDQDLEELGSSYTVPAGKELLLTDACLSSGNAAQFMQYRFREGAAGNIHFLIYLPKGNSQPEGYMMNVKLADIWTAGLTPNLNANQAEATAVFKGVEYSV